VVLADHRAHPPTRKTSYMHKRSKICRCHAMQNLVCHHHHTTSVLRPIFRDHPGESVPEENFWTLSCKARLTEADTPTIWLSATPAGLTSAHLHHPPYFTGRMPILRPNQQCQSTEGMSIVQFYTGCTQALVASGD